MCVEERGKKERKKDTVRVVSMMGICCDKRSCCFLCFIKLKGGNKVVLRAVGMYS